jgi:hypothetical protein
MTGSNAYTDWFNSAANGGKSGSVVFAGFEKLTGGSGVDSFRFSAGGSLTGTLDGGPAPAHQGNWLDYSGLTTPVMVNPPDRRGHRRGERGHGQGGQHPERAWRQRRQYTDWQ